MTSMPASRNARATTFAPRSCPSSPGFAITTRIVFEPCFAIELGVRSDGCAGLLAGEMILGALPRSQSPTPGARDMARNARDWIDFVLDRGWEERDAGLASSD